MSPYEYPIADIALGIFFGWFLIRIAIRVNGGVQEITEDLARYFEIKDRIKKMEKDKS